MTVQRRQEQPEVTIVSDSEDDSEDDPKNDRSTYAAAVLNHKSSDQDRVDMSGKLSERTPTPTLTRSVNLIVTVTLNP